MPSTIISASRRTDIPAFYMPWIMNRLRAGSVSYPNPFGGQTCTLSLLPDDVHSIVFWSKFYGPFLQHIDELHTRDYRFICHYTITGAPRALEPFVPNWEHAAEIFRHLSRRTSPQHILWRFDPMVFTPELDAAFYLARFRDLAQTLQGYTQRCYFSFASYYRKVQHKMKQAGLAYVDPPLEVKLDLLNSLAGIADENGITLYACCQDALLNERIQQAHCVDGDLLSELFPDRPAITKANPTREQCGCVASRDIGMYDTCPYGCVYCYANTNHAATVKHRQNHHPAHESLVDM